MAGRTLTKKTIKIKIKMENQLVKIINESGLDKTKGQVLLEQFSGYFEIASEWEAKANQLVITNVEQIAEMKMAREGRLFLRDKRVAVEKTRKLLKESSLREGQTIDAVARILTNLITPIEKDLEAKERFAEIKEAERIEALREERYRETEEYIEFIPHGLDLGKMDDDNYEKLLNGAKLQMEQKLENERKAEEERIRKEASIKLHNQRKETILPFWNFIPIEYRDVDFSTLTEQEWNERLEWTIQQKKEHDEEHERLKKEAEERERQLAEERAKAEAERKKSEQKLEAEREQKRKLEAELKAKEEAERQAKLEAERKALEEQRKKEAAERKAKNAPDKEKLLAFAEMLENISYPELLSDDAKSILSVVQLDIGITIKEIRTKSETL